MPEESTRAEINRLYWESDLPVSELAERLDISRRSLYDRIDPQPADATCPECGGSMHYRNRTAAANRDAECAACGLEEQLDPVSPAPEAEEQDAPEPQVEQEERAGRLAPVSPVTPAGSGPLLGTTLLAGLALGAAAGLLFRRG